LILLVGGFVFNPGQEIFFGIFPVFEIESCYNNSMRYSGLFGKSIKTDPADTQLISHKLLVKGGFVRRVSTGRWSFLPLGLRVWEKVMGIIDEEMKTLGVQRMEVPTLQPIEVWQVSNRDKAFGSEMLVIEDHHGATFALGATAEGVMAEVVKMFSPSYKDLPIEIYQFSKKFRDDKRPRGGLMRVREFMMKDAYTFAADEKQFEKSYQMYFDAYLRIAKKLGLKVVPVEADSGAIGGSASHEFMVESSNGDNTFVVCNKCSYKANLEKAVFIKEEKNVSDEEKKLEEVEAKRGTTMEDGVKLHQLPLWQQIKDVLYVDENGRFILAIIRGDYNVNELKLKKIIDASELRHATDKEIRQKIHSEPGFISPVKIKELVSKEIKLLIVADDSLKGIKNAYGGANKKHRDLLNINWERDYQADFEADIAEVNKDASCAKCQGGKLSFRKGFEWSHCFNIGQFYTQPQKCNFTDKDGKDKPLWMGSYGIGLGRSIACMVEQNHDDKGIIWPKSVAPFDYHLICLGEEVKQLADKAYEALTKKGKEVLFDDREDVSAGEKFANADLLGIPVRLVISKKTNGKIEVKERDKKENKLLELEKLLPS